MADFNLLDPEEKKRLLAFDVTEPPSTVPSPANPIDDAVKAYIGQQFQDRLKAAEGQYQDYAHGWRSVLPELVANIGGAIAGQGGNAYSGAFDKLRQGYRDSTVGALQRERQNAFQALVDRSAIAQAKRQSELDDPNSEASKAYQKLRMYLTGEDTPITAAQGKEALPALSMIGEMEAKKAAAAAKEMVRFDSEGIAHPVDPENPAHVSKANEENSRRSERQGTASRQERILAATLGEKQYAREAKEEERSRERQARTIPGIGTFGTPKEAEEVRKLYSAKQGIDASVKALRKMYENRDVLDLAKSYEAKAEGTRLILQLKELANLGVLNGPDMVLMNQIAPGDVNSPDFFGSKRVLLEGVAKRANLDWQNTLKRYNYEPDPKRAELEALRQKAAK